MLKKFIAFLSNSFLSLSKFCSKVFLVLFKVCNKFFSFLSKSCNKVFSYLFKVWKKIFSWFCYAFSRISEALSFVQKQLINEVKSKAFKEDMGVLFVLMLLFVGWMLSKYFFSG